MRSCCLAGIWSGLLPEIKQLMQWMRNKDDRQERRGGCVQKLKNTYIDRMIQEKLSSAEIDFILYIARFQNDRGVVQSVYYKDVCEAVGISIQKFYDIRDSLAQKQLIQWAKFYYADIVVTLVDNDFSDKDFTGGYLNVAAKDFASENFRSMKAGSKRLYLYMQRFQAGKHMLTENFYKEFSRMFHVAAQSIRIYLKQLKDNGFLFVNRKRNRAGNYEMGMKNSALLDVKKCGMMTEKEAWHENLAKMLRWNFRTKLPDEEETADRTVRDIVKLLDTYKKKGIGERFGIVLKAVKNSLHLQQGEGKKDPVLNAALVNKCVRQLFEEENLENNPYEYLF